jgi:hypothetical protein
MRIGEIFRNFTRPKNGSVLKKANQDVYDRLQINKELAQPGCDARVSA